MKKPDTSKTVTLDPERVLGELERRQTPRFEKQTTSTFNDILILMDELPVEERRRLARAIAIYYEVYR